MYTMLIASFQSLNLSLNDTAPYNFWCCDQRKLDRSQEVDLLMSWPQSAPVQTPHWRWRDISQVFSHPRIRTQFKAHPFRCCPSGGPLEVATTKS